MKGLKSRAATPRQGTPGAGTGPGTPVEDDYATTLVSAELQARLQELVVDDESAARKDSFSMAAELLATDRGKTSIQEREEALLIILTVLANKFEPERVTAPLLRNLIRAFSSRRSDVEALLALQAVSVAISFVDEDHSAYDLCHEAITAFLPRLLKAIKDGEDSPQLSASMTTAYSVLSFFMNFGGGGFNVDTLANELMEIAETTTAKQAALATAALMGVALVATLSSTSEKSTLVEDFGPGITPFLGMSNEVKLAAARLLGVLFEDSEVEDFDTTEIKDALDAVLSESSHRTAKRDKRQTKSLFKDVLRTVDGDPPTMLTHFTLSKQKSLPLRSWAMLVVVQHLKWVYGPGLHTQIANNPFVQELLTDEDDDGPIQLEQLSISEPSGGDSPGQPQRKAVDRKQARLDKMEALGVLDH